MRQYLLSELEGYAGAVFHLVISEPFFRKTRMWPKTSPPTYQYNRELKEDSTYRLKCSPQLIDRIILVRS